MMRNYFIILFICIISSSGFSQNNENVSSRIRFQGLVMDANTLSPVSNSHILINRDFSTITDKNGNFAFYVNPNDTIVFQSLGYKPATMLISDTLIGHEYIAGIYMKSDTLLIPEVVIVPRYTNIKSDILNSPSWIPSTMDNARYNVAIGAYQGRTSQSKLGDPASNYEFLRQREKINAFEKGGIPSDRIIGLNPLLLIPGVYMLMHGVPEKPSPLKPDISDYELQQLQKKYLESLKSKK
jgi:hypothetical protein